MAQNYTRQSSFADGDTITASLFNNEYNQLVNAFAYSSTDVSATGHRHDGSIGQGGNIAQIGDLDFNNKIVVDGTNNRWGFFVEVAGASVEQIRLQDGSIIPVTTNDIDLGSASLQFKDAYFDGTVNADSLVLSSGATVTVILDEDAMTSNSATALATQQSIKAYVDSQVTAQDLDFQGDSGGALSIDLDSETLTIAGGTGIDTSGAINTLTVSIDSTVATLTGTQTLTNKTLTSPDINGGTIDGAVIGATTAAAGSFTTVAASGNITVGGTVDGRDVAADGTKLDGIESGATADQTAAEIRALVEAATDSNVFTDADHTKLNGIEALADVTDTTNVTAAGALMDSELTNITAVKALNQGVATTDSPSFAGLTATTADINGGTIDGTVIGGSSAAAGTFTSITGTSANINGTVTADGLTVANAVEAEVQLNSGAGQNSQVRFAENGTNQWSIYHNASTNDLRLYDHDNATNRINFANNGDISFYEDTGTTAKFFWDASAESLGIGTSSPTYALDVSTTASSIGGRITTNTSGSYLSFLDNGGLNGYVRVGAVDNNLVMLAGNAERMRIDASGNVGIGTSSPVTNLQVYKATGGLSGVQISNSTHGATLTDGLFVGIDNSVSYLYNYEAIPLVFGTNGTERMRIDSAGNVGIGTTSPSGYSASYKQLIIDGGANASMLQLNNTTTGSGGNTGGLALIQSGVDAFLVNPQATGNTILYTNNTERMRIDSAGNVGIGTTPTYRLDVDAPATVGLRLRDSTASSSELNLGIGTITAGRPFIGTNTSSNPLEIGTRGNVDTIFYTNSAERARIDSSGNLLVGTTSSTAPHTLTSGSGGAMWSNSLYISIARTSDSLFLNRIGSDGGVARFYRDGGTDVGSISVTASTTAYNITSDYRLKENVVSMDNASDRVLALNPVRFNFIADPDKTVDGFLAHEAQEVAPEAVTGSKDAMRTEEYEVSPAVLDEDGNVVTEAVMGTREVPDYQGIDQSKLVPLLTKALQEALERIAVLESKVGA